MSDTSATGVAATCGSLLGLTMLAIILRFNARLKQETSLGMDDWLMIPTWVLFVGLTTDMFYGISRDLVGGNPQPPAEGQATDQNRAFESIVTMDILSILSVLSLGLVKLSALFFYLRVFRTGNWDMFSVATVVFIALVATYTFVYFLVCLVLCVVSIHEDWRMCATVGILQAMIYTDVIFEFLVLVLPIPKVWTLRLPVQKRIAVSSVFLLATIGFISSCARLAFYLKLSDLSGENLYKGNTAWEFFTILETGLTIIAVNLPLIWYYVHQASFKSFMHHLGSIIPHRLQRSSTSHRGDAFEEGYTEKEKVTEDGHCHQEKFFV